MIDANQVWDVPEAIEWVERARRVQAAVDRGADQPRRRPRPRRDPPGGRADRGGHRRARHEPRAVQADVPGRGASTSASSTPRGWPASTRSSPVYLLAKKFGVPVCPHAGGVGLCELVQHLSIFDYVAVSGSLENRVTEFVDHLHEHFLEPASSTTAPTRADGGRLQRRDGVSLDRGVPLPGRVLLGWRARRVTAVVRSGWVSGLARTCAAQQRHQCLIGAS